MNLTVEITLLSLLAFLLLLSGTCALTCVPQGHVGVITTFGAVSEDTLSEGMRLVLPWQSVTDISVQAQNYSIECAADDPKASVTSDLQTVGFTVDIGWYISDTDTWRLLRYVGNQDKYGKEVIEPCMWQGLKEVTSTRDLETIIKERELVREEIGLAIEKLIQERLAARHEQLRLAIDVTQVTLGNIDYSDDFEEIITQKQIAAQEALRATNVLRKIEIEAQQQVVQAEAQRYARVHRAQGEADALRLQALAEAEAYLRLRQAGVNPMQNRFLETWNGTLPQVLAGGEGLGIIMPSGSVEGDLTPEDIQLLLTQLGERRAELEATQTRPNEE